MSTPSRIRFVTSSLLILAAGLVLFFSTETFVSCGASPRPSHSEEVPLFAISDDPDSKWDFPVTTYVVPDTCHVIIIVKDSLGTVVDTLVNAVQIPGSYEKTWEGPVTRSGVHYFEFTICGTLTTKKFEIVHFRGGR
jgi:hypothetical protein